MGARGFIRVTLIVAVMLLGAACSSPSTGHRSSPNVPSSSSGRQHSSSPTRGPVAVSVRSPKGGSLLVRGIYPRVQSKCKHPEQPSLKARYPGTLSIRRADDGSLGLTVTLPFERYLEGIAEVPPSWPVAALEAQAIAARSYALASTGWGGPQGGKFETPICGTASCQVYAGIPVRPERAIHPWLKAVRRTAGRVLKRSLLVKRLPFGRRA
jgi:peptidoglycan hydrolase-like amidase